MEIKIFDYVNSILYKKKKLSLTDLEDINFISPYIINRWISAYDDSLLVFVNETVNKNIIYTLRNKKMIYDYYYNVIPRMKYKRFQFISPSKGDKSKKTKEDEEIIKYLAERLEISRKESKYLLEKDLIDIKFLTRNK